MSRRALLIGTEERPIETINMASPPAKSVVVDLWQDLRPLWVPRLVQLVYKINSSGG